MKGTHKPIALRSGGSMISDGVWSRPSQMGIDPLDTQPVTTLYTAAPTDLLR